MCDWLVFMVCMCRIVVLGDMFFEMVFLYKESLNIGELLFKFCIEIKIWVGVLVKSGVCFLLWIVIFILCVEFFLWFKFLEIMIILLLLIVNKWWGFFFIMEYMSWLLFLLFLFVVVSFNIEFLIFVVLEIVMLYFSGLKIGLWLFILSIVIRIFVKVVKLGFWVDMNSEYVGCVLWFNVFFRVILFENGKENYCLEFESFINGWFFNIGFVLVYCII